MQRKEISFTTTIVREKDRTYLALPTEVETIWGGKEHHYVAGTIQGRTFRGRTEIQRRDEARDSLTPTASPQVVKHQRLQHGQQYQHDAVQHVKGDKETGEAANEQNEYQPE
jgi:hypothetical protein